MKENKLHFRKILFKNSSHMQNRNCIVSNRTYQKESAKFRGEDFLLNDATQLRILAMKPKLYL